MDGIAYFGEEEPAVELEIDDDKENVPPMDSESEYVTASEQLSMDSEPEFVTAESDDESDEGSDVEILSDSDAGSTMDVSSYDFHFDFDEDEDDDTVMNDVTDDQMERINQIPTAEATRRNINSLANLCIGKILATKIEIHQAEQIDLDLNGNEFPILVNLEKLINTFASPNSEVIWTISDALRLCYPAWVIFRITFRRSTP